MNIDKIMKGLKKTAAGFGLPFEETKKTYNSRLAQELGLWAETQNRGDEFHHAVFKAYFADGKNIAKIPVLLELAESVNLSRKEAGEVLEMRSFKTAVDEDWSRSQKKEIKAVPSFVINQSRLVGAQPYEKLEKLLQKNGVGKRST
ncbi:DSBA oxidoreductase [Desulfonema magnum]|uniref:DSBA oxidoreductase n=1 Tax=Desulfonema magnum TaxID=45655 RepID=A0A975BLR7_9BACT|nr:DSBA oxidoreductase [Desulfonema magnum]